jgi:hypothetical protein
MDLSDLLAQSAEAGARRFQGTLEAPPVNRQYNSRHTGSAYNMHPHGGDMNMTDVYPTTEAPQAHEMLSPTKSANPKHVSFELLLPQSPQHRARLPMRVNIFPHDTTDSIITTVKNFYGLYERRGVIFEDRHGNILIARYENLDHDMVVYVRVTAEDPEMDEYSPGPAQSMSPRRPRLEDAFQMLPPALHPPSRHAAVRQSHSPQPGRGRRSASASTNVKPRGRTLVKSRGTSSHGSFADGNGDAGAYSDSDGGDASVTSSRRSRKEQVASADISVDNIVEGGRRKRAKFDSSVSISCLMYCIHSDLTFSLSAGAPTLRPSSGSHDRFSIIRFSSEANQQPKWCLTVLAQQSTHFLVLACSSIPTELRPGRFFIPSRFNDTILHFKWSSARISVSHAWLGTIHPISAGWSQRRGLAYTRPYSG